MLILNSMVCYAEPIKLTASWYSEASLKQDGQWAITKGRCADGSIFKDTNYSAASWDFPLKTKLRVTTVKAPKKSIIVENTDRTARRFKGKRCDLSKRAFSEIANLEQGLVEVYVEVVK